MKAGQALPRIWRESLRGRKREEVVTENTWRCEIVLDGVSLVCEMVPSDIGDYESYYTFELLTARVDGWNIRRLLGSKAVIELREMARLSFNHNDPENFRWLHMGKIPRLL